MSASAAWGAMGMGAFKIADGGLGVVEGEVATVATDGAGAVPAFAWNALYAGIAVEGAHEFSGGFKTVFGSDDSASAPPSGMVANSDRPSDPAGVAKPGATPRNAEDVEGGIDPTRREALRQAKRDAGVPANQEPSIGSEDLLDRDNKPIMENGQPVQTRVYRYKTTDGRDIVIQEHSHGHQFGEDGVGDQGPHFNVRPKGDEKTGKVKGTQGHYPFGK